MTKLTLKSTLSATTQAKITSLMTDNLKQTEKKIGKKLSKTKVNKITPQPKSPSLPQAAVTPSSSDHQQSLTPSSTAKRSYYTNQERATFKERISGAQAWLQETFSDIFDPTAPKPLKRHIAADLFPLLPTTVTRTQLRDALSAWVMRRAYHQSLLDHKHRYDLSGQPVEAILTEHHDHARQQLVHKQAQFEQQKQRRANYHKKQKLSRLSRDKPVDNSSLEIKNSTKP